MNFIFMILIFAGLHLGLEWHKKLTIKNTVKSECLKSNGH